MQTKATFELIQNETMTARRRVARIASKIRKIKGEGFKNILIEILMEGIERSQTRRKGLKPREYRGVSLG